MELGFLDIIHPCDQELVKEQLLVTDCDHPAGEKKSTAADFNMVNYTLFISVIKSKIIAQKTGILWTPSLLWHKVHSVAS